MSNDRSTADRPASDDERGEAPGPRKEFLEKLAALIPRSRVNLVLYHGVLAPHARWRARVVAFGDSGPHARREPSPPEVSETARPGATPRYRAWAHLMRHAFDIDVLACPRCGGCLRLVATIEDPRVIRAILAHLGLPAEVPQPDPPQPPPAYATGFTADVVA